MKTVHLGVVMDPIGSIQPKKDSTLAMLLAAQSKGWQMVYMELNDLRLCNGRAEATMRPLKVRDNPKNWFQLEEASDGALGSLDIILMRKDPPVDVEYIMATYILERAEAEGVLVVNRPRTLRDVNEKIFTQWFPQCCPASLLSRSKSALREFLAMQRSIVLKPVNAMGGRSVFVLREGDPNTNVIFEEMTREERRFVLAQALIPGIETSGDKRILLIDGEPVSQGITRMPSPGDPRANLAAGGTAKGCELTDRDRWICGQIGPELRDRGLYFVGIDIIGEYLTEINVTSPTCIREIDRIFGVDIAADLMSALEKRLRR